MISIKDYAADNGVSYEAVRRQIVQYREQLEGHIHLQGRKQFLDDVAIAFLNQHRAQNPVSVYNKEAVEELRTLKEENQKLLKEIAELQRWRADNAMAIAAAAQTQFALTAAQGEVKKLEDKLAIQEGFTRDAKVEIAHLMEEHAQELTQARQEMQKEQDARKAAENDKEALRAAQEALKARNWWERLFRKGE